MVAGAFLLFPFGTLMFLILSSPFVFVRMRTQPCGFTGLVPEQCHPFQAAPITVYRDRLSRLLDTVRLSSRHRITEVLITQISTFLRPASLWTISSKTLERGFLVALKANLLSSPTNSYGKTTTNPAALLVFQGHVTSLRATSECDPSWLIWIDNVLVAALFLERLYFTHLFLANVT